MAKEMAVYTAFECLDTEGKGFLTLRSFHANFGKMFGFYLKSNEVIALFKEIDKDEDSIVYF
jgi:Ca2+-binding EF-hand superfamily protein